MIRTVIVDDEPVIRHDIAALLQGYPDISVVGMYGSVREAVTYIPVVNPQLLLLDVQLGDGYSFDILKQLPRLQCAVIFITAYDKHAIHAIRVGALDYLLKPVDEYELQEALGKVQERRQDFDRAQLSLADGRLNGQDATRDRIALRSQQDVRVIGYDELLYCEGAGNYTTFYLTDGKKLVIARPLKEYEELLPSVRFIRSHQSYLVNKQFVARYDREGCLVLQNDTRIPVSARKKELVLAAITGQK